MSDVTATTAAPPATAPTAPAPAAAPAPAPATDVATQLAALQAQLADLQAKAAAPGVVKSTGIFAWEKTKCGARLVSDFYKFLDGAKTLIFFGVSGSLALANELEAIDLTPYIGKFLPAGAHLDTAGTIVLFSLAGVGLRLISKTPAFVRWTSNKIQGGASDSVVDAPKD